MDRSEIMRRVKSSDTTPERKVRAALRRLGNVGYRLQRKDLPGKPDIAFIGLRKAIFVHGCFWHGHDCKRGDRQPKNNAEYWKAKIGRNTARDADNLSALRSLGWSVLVVWECETRAPEALDQRLKAFLRSGPV